MNILYIGDSSKESLPRYRANALKRLNHIVFIEDPIPFFLKSYFFRTLLRLHYKTGYVLAQKLASRFAHYIISKYSDKYLDIIWIDSGELFGANAIAQIKKCAKKIILYNCDDITGNRDGYRFSSLKYALNHYDLIVSVRDITCKELSDITDCKILRVQRSYDEIGHTPKETDIKESIWKLNADVIFVGTWMRNENRDDVLNHLVLNGINIAIWGDRWQKSPHWNNLKKYWHGSEIRGIDYASLIQQSPITLGFVSKGNRDEATYRTFEVPYSGGLLCAQMTNEHLEIYKDFARNFFWTDKYDCLEKCKNILSLDYQANLELRAYSRDMIIKGGFGNENICKKILTETMLIL